MNNSIILYFDICALGIVIIFMISNVVRGRLEERGNKILFILLWLMFFATLGDIGSGWMDNFAEPNETNIMISYVSNYVYFLTHNLILPVYVLYIYASVGIWHVFTKSAPLTNLWKLLVVVDIVELALNPLTHSVFVVDEAVNYCRRPMITVFYVIAVFFALWGIAIIVLFRKLVNVDKFIIMIGIFPIIFGAVIIQAIWSNWLVEMFAIAISLLFYMIVVQRQESMEDPITGALKYNAGINRVQKVFMTHKPVTVVLVKIVNFRNIRLYLGQERFDKFLGMQTQMLKNIAKKRNFQTEIYYLEYGLFAYLSEEYNVEKALPIAEDIKKGCAEKFLIDGFTVMPDARICVVRCPEDMEEFSTLFAFGTTFHKTLPDTNNVILYYKFKNDRNFKVRNSMDEIITRGLEERRFEMYYQPIYSISKKKFVSAEALIRLYDREYGYISPGMFLPAAEASGAIHEIGDFVMEDVLRFISKNDIKRVGLDYIEINLSPAQCIESDLVEKTLTLMEDYGVSPDMVSLELTESAADINPKIVDKNVQQLKNEGVRFALDDYGTGYSNIKRVISLPIDQVKLDKSFVDNIDDPHMWSVIMDTVKMLKEMGKEVLIEGVEDEEVAHRFYELNADLIQGCELMQGFLFCRPMPEKDFINFMEEHASA